MTNQHTARSWPDERIERLKLLWKTTGLTAKQIADEFGITRNAVIGKLHRLELSMADRPSKEDMSLEERLRNRRAELFRAQRKLEAHPDKLAKRRAQWAEKKAELASLDGGQQRVKMPNGGAALTIGYLEPKAIGPSNPVGQVPLLDLAKGECRWPKGHGTIAEPFTFCGATQAEGFSYCPAHSRKAYGPDPRPEGGLPPRITASYPITRKAG